MSDLATDLAVAVADIRRLHESFDINDPLRHVKADLRRSAEQTLALAVTQVNTLLGAAKDMQLNFDDAKRAAQEDAS